MILHSYDFTTMAEDCLGKIYFKVDIGYIGVQSLKKHKQFLNNVAGEVQPRVRNIDCEFAQVQVLSRSTYQEWGHCQVRDIVVMMLML